MTSPARSAYPVPVADLIPKARTLADDLGTVPSRNRLMSEFRIGASKARAVLAELESMPATESAKPAPEPVEPHLHAVPDVETRREAKESPEVPDAAPVSESAQDSSAVDPDTAPATAPAASTPRTMHRWPLVLMAIPAFVAVWSGWVGLGELTGFGVVHPLPGIADDFSINSAITLPIGVETYAAFALRAWLSGDLPLRARRFAKWSAIGSLALGALGQVAYHLLAAANVTQAPWQITTLVACLPVAVLGMGAALAHLIHDQHGKA